MTDKLVIIEGNVADYGDADCVPASVFDRLSAAGFGPDETPKSLMRSIP